MIRVPPHIFRRMTAGFMDGPRSFDFGVLVDHPAARFSADGILLPIPLIDGLPGLSASIVFRDVLLDVFEPNQRRYIARFVLDYVQHDQDHWLLPIVQTTCVGRRYDGPLL